MLAAMNRRAFVCAAAAVSSAMAQANPLDAIALKTLQQQIDAAINARRLPGAVLWIEQLGRPPHTQVFGQRAWLPTPEALRLDAVFDVASLTKPVVTGMLCAQLIEGGQLALDAPVQRTLPEFSGRASITLRHLLTHSSGLPAILPLEPAWIGAGSAHALACAALPTHPPGTLFRYSDINYILLGNVIERIAGKSLAELAEQRVLRPLGMTDSGYLPLLRHPTERLVPTEFDGATMLRGQVHDPAARRMGGVAGHAGLFAPVADLARFARAMLEQHERWRMMTSNASPAGLAPRGLGWDIESPYSRPRGKVYPVGGFGHTGFTGCAMWINPGSQSFYVFLSNRVHPRGNDSIVALYEEVGTAAARAVGLP